MYICRSSLQIPPFQESFFRISANVPPGTAPGTALSAQFTMVSNDPMMPLKDIWWVVTVQSQQPLLIVSSTHPLNLPLKPQVFEMTVTAGTASISRVTLVNLGNMDGVLTLTMVRGRASKSTCVWLL